MRQPLGRGLDAILGSGGTEQRASAPPRPASARETTLAGTPLMVSVDRVMAGRGQPRRLFSEHELQELAASIRENGILQPLVVVPRGGSFELIAGERRLRAARLVGLSEVPVVVREVGGDAEMLELALVENLQREDLGPLERARAYEKLASRHGLSQEDIATKVGKSRVAVSNTMRLLALAPPVLDVVDRGELSEGQARALLGLATAKQQVDAMRVVLARGLSVREVEALVRSMASGAGTGSGTRGGKPKRSASPLEADLGRALGTRVRVRGGMKKGRIEIEYFSQEELTRLIDVLSSNATR